MLRYFTAGESHGPCLTMIIDGVPAGFPIDVSKVNHDLWRRQQGYGRGGRMLIEKDEVQIRSAFVGARHLARPLPSVLKTAIGKTGPRRCQRRRKTEMKRS